MKTETTIYKISVYNDTNTNDIALTSSSILEIDLKMNELKNEGKHGFVLMNKVVENKEFNYRKETNEVMLDRQF